MDCGRQWGFRDPWSIRLGNRSGRDAFATNGRAALRDESGCSTRKALPTALRSGWAAALSSRSVDIIAAGPSGVNKHAIHDNVCIVSGRWFFLQVGRRLRRCAWVLLRGADIGAAGHLLGSSQDTRHDLSLSSVFFAFSSSADLPWSTLRLSRICRFPLCAPQQINWLRRSLAVAVEWRTLKAVSETSLLTPLVGPLRSNFTC